MWEQEGLLAVHVLELGHLRVVVAVYQLTQKFVHGHIGVKGVGDEPLLRFESCSFGATFMRLAQFHLINILSAVVLVTLVDRLRKEEGWVAGDWLGLWSKQGREGVRI